ncbi:uncharacterized protein LOC111998565 [Quercus suber]|uniref:uncharacterized protein LOC111998565 n=1 Tax=Quercus suber TaxID=58331 RepID=UPI000CE18D25|nr:uncharacterized protein LOC111998565 [Quercus suber]
MELGNPPSPSLTITGWAIWYHNKAIAIPDVVIAQIQAAPTEALGKFEEELERAWKHMFPITQTSINTGNLPLDHPAWGTTPNPWWRFLTDAPLISEMEAQELNKLRRPLVQPYLDEYGWLVQERKVIDFRGTMTSHLGNQPTMKLIHTVSHMKSCDLLLCCREEIQGILSYMVVWKPEWVVSKDMLRRLGWSMMASARMGTNPLEIPNTYCAKINIILWNCRGALNPDFKRRVMEILVNHFPAMLIITETRVGDVRAAKIIEELPFDGFFVTDTVGYAGGLWLLWKKEEVEVFVLSATEQEIHATVKVPPGAISSLQGRTYL